MYISSHTNGDNLNISLAMKGFHPRYDWMLLDLRGIAGRDMFAYLTGLPSSFDLRLDANITQNTTYGREVIRADLKFSSSQPLGPFLASIGRLAPENTRVMMMASSLVPELAINVYLGERLDLRYRASDQVEHLYVKTSRLVDGRWHSTTALLHDIPRTVDVSLAPPGNFDAGAGPSQMLPELSVSADAGTLDLFVDLDGRSTGQRSSYQVELKDAGEFVTGRSSGGVYKLRSSGTEEIYLRLRDMPYRKGFAITSLGLYLENLRSLDLGITMVFGAYPVFRISSLKADSVHLAVGSRLDIGGQRQGHLVLADSRSAGGLPAGVQLFQNGLVSGASNNDDHLVVPMPLATLMWTLLGG
jgi:hypothetical protein